jgi:mono/diheme cytochrome c family protein
MVRLFALGGLIGLAALGATEARAQTDLSAGMTPAQLFAANCAACHRSPRGLARGRDPATVAYFLRDHYTTRPAIAAALASYLASNRGPAPRPAAQGAVGGEEAGSAAPVAPTRPLQRLANTTVERLKSFAADADPAKPSAPDAPERGSARLLSYSASGAAADALREAAVAAAVHGARSGAPEQGPRPSSVVTPRGDDAAAKKDASASGNAAAASARGTQGAVLPLRGPPPSNAMPTTQSNDNMR